MSSSICYVRGTARWAKTHPKNMDADGYKGQAREYGGQYTIDLLLDDTEKQKYILSGTAGRVRDAEDGLSLVKFKRKHSVVINGNTRSELGGPPRVFMLEDGEPVDVTDQNITIGNDSTVVVKFEVYPTSGENGTRLTSILIEELVESEQPEVEVIGDEDTVAF